MDRRAQEIHPEAPGTAETPTTWARAKDILWRFRFSASVITLYFLFQWGFGHLTFTTGYFATPGDPNYVTLTLGLFTFFTRFSILFAVPAHITYVIVGLIVEGAHTFHRAKR
ncbi:MAG TPA: hypothetical protein VNO21_05925 [Polyangiaceae bacterium]|nr:hypothetical protein [Polyangiaceae bacterium]